MRTYVCGTCGEVVEAIGSQVWHRCQGKMRELHPTEPPATPAPVSGQGSLFR